MWENRQKSGRKSTCYDRMTGTSVVVSRNGESAHVCSTMSVCADKCTCNNGSLPFGEPHNPSESPIKAMDMHQVLH